VAGAIDQEVAAQEGPALRAAERAFIELRAQAGRVLGGGPRAFQEYESGKAPVSGPMKNLLVLLDKDPRRLRELRAKLPRPRGRRKGTSAPTAT
jgi:HTH-type transcriptional regulator/antitoxin MqsA